jgi:hypothetical protein
VLRLNPVDGSGVSVGISVGVSVAAGIWLGVGLRVGVFVPVGVNVALAIEVKVDDGVKVNEGVKVNVLVVVEVEVGIGVRVGDGVAGVSEFVGETGGDDSKSKPIRSSEGLDSESDPGPIVGTDRFPKNELMGLRISSGKFCPITS